MLESVDRSVTKNGAYRTLARAASRLNLILTCRRQDARPSGRTAEARLTLAQSSNAGTPGSESRDGRKQRSEDVALGAKRAKIALIVVLFGAAGYFVYSTLVSSGPLENRIRLVCVSTGEEFWMARDQVTQIPMLHPRTKEETLLPCSPGTDGALHIDDHYRAALESVGDKNKVVDPQTLLVKPHG